MNLPRQKHFYGLLLAAFLLAGHHAAMAEDCVPEALGEVALEQALKDLANPFRLMCVAAHPDDEDGATLAYYRHKYGARTCAVIATRGEGGQNEIGPELYEELAVIRTAEMREAAKIEGAELRFLDLPEFGFSKSIEETFEIWGPEETLRRMVAQIRDFQPQVIITHHGRMKDHGHHQAIGQILQEAFDAAADPARFPEQLSAHPAWQASRLFIRNWEGGGESRLVPLHELEPLRGLTYAEIAASALEAHKSQGMKFFIDQLLTGRASASYDLVKSHETPAQGLPAGVEFGALFEGLPLAGPLRTPLAKELPAEALLALAAVPEMSAERTLDASTAAAVALQLRFSITLPPLPLTPGNSFEAVLALDDFGSAEVDSVKFRFAGLEQFLDSPEGHRYGWTARVALPPDARPNLPAALHLREAPAAPFPPATAEVTLKSRHEFELSVTPEWRIAPALQLEFSNSPYLLRTRGAESVSVNLQAHQYSGDARTMIAKLSGDAGLVLTQDSANLVLAAGESAAFASTLAAIARPRTEGVYALRAQAGDSLAESAVHVVDVRIPRGLRVGVISSYDTTLLTTLKKLGVEHVSLDEPSALANLDGLDTIVADMRAYQYRPDLAAANAGLLEWVKQGGTMIVLYQKTFDWKPEYAPYPLRVSRNRVTREDAAVRPLVPQHPVFHEPNEISEEDWSGWIQERGLYFPDEWDARYTALIDTQDPGEQIPPGALLVASYGRGTYVYTALALYRQWNALHPGALRVLANLLSLRGSP